MDDVGLDCEEDCAARSYVGGVDYRSYVDCAEPVVWDQDKVQDWSDQVNPAEDFVALVQVSAIVEIRAKSWILATPLFPATSLSVVASSHLFY